MSTATTSPTAAPARSATRTAGPTAGVLTRVELRKMVNTRAGRWLLIVAALITVVVAIVRVLTGDADQRTVGDAFELTLLPLGVLLPVIGILAATGEWSQRTALSTFALVPRRGRVVGAKLSAVLLLGAAGLVVGLAASLVAGAVASVAGDAPDPWAISGATIGQAVLFAELNILWGLAFGLVLFAPAMAIVAYFVLPTVFTLLGQISDGVGNVVDWIDPNTALSPLTEGTAAGDDWAKIALTGVLWIALPLAAGIVRTLRREVK